MQVSFEISLPFVKKVEKVFTLLCFQFAFRGGECLHEVYLCVCV